VIPVFLAALGLAAPANAKVELGDRQTVSGPIVSLIKAAFPGEARTAICIAQHESRLQPRAYYLGNIGVFQINWSAHSHLNRARLFEPQYNIRAARSIYLDAKRRYGNGWLPWYTRGFCRA
jgi:hypothetical protein